MAKPTRKVIADRLTRAGVTERHVKPWSTFLHGLDWPILKPLVQLALNSHVHPALAAGMVIRSTNDEQIKATLQAHLEAKRSDHLTQEADEVVTTGQRCEDCGCCLASECTEGVCDTKGTGPQWCPCAGAEEQAHPESTDPTEPEGTTE